MFNNVRTALPLVPFFCLVACTSEAPVDETGSQESAASERNAKIVDNIAPTATVEGSFDPRVRTYGYVVAAKAGAKITAKLEAKAGADARRFDANEPLDTGLRINGPYTSRTKTGPRLADTDDTSDTDVGAPPASVTLAQDGNYLVSFQSFEDTGTGSYKLTLTCEGTDFQCQRPNFQRPCTQGQLFVQGARIEGNTTWDQCEVVLLESAVVPAGSTLTIKPGVVVKGNYLGTGGFGNVSLTVDGLLQAAGTKAAPIAFTSLKADRGWAGLVFRSQANTLQNVVIEKARTGVTIATGGAVDITDALIQGVTLQNEMPVAGVMAGMDVVATFERALVKGFQNGLQLSNAQHLVITDSVVRENVIGVRVDGANPIAWCTNVATPARWRDPVITNSDIILNQQQGVLIAGSDVLVQIEKSNIVGNKGYGIEIQGATLNPASYFRGNNVYDNGANVAGVDVRTFHSMGVLDLSGNHWKDISDPELSANWQRACGNPSNILFTGFSPTPIKNAGPRKSTLIPAVKDGCFLSD